MRTAPTLLLLLAAAISGASRSASAQAADSLELLRLETVWNRAHVEADTVALARLWTDDLEVTVPEMPPMSKADLLRFWRSGRSAIARYETSEVHVKLYGDAAVVTGRLRRERNFNGSLLTDDWRFTKAYVRRRGQWQVAAYHASQRAGP